MVRGISHLSYAIVHKSRTERDRRYQASERGRARSRKYNKSAKGKERQQRYQRTRKGRLARWRYLRGPKGQVVRAKAKARVLARFGRRAPEANSASTLAVKRLFGSNWLEAQKPKRPRW